MIRARKSAAFNFVMRRWVGAVIRRRFHGVFLAGGEHLRSLAPNQPVVGCVNHTNWWDGFVLYALSHHRLPHDIYLAMDESNLRRYLFFTWMGVFGVALGPRAGNVAALRYAAGLLRSGAGGLAPLVWMFVQGALVSERRPVAARPGAAFLASRSGAALLPVALRYTWLAESRPSIFIRVGPPLPAGASSTEIADSLNALLAQTDLTLDPPVLAGYEPLFEPRKSIHTRWDDICARLRALTDVFDKTRS